MAAKKYIFSHILVQYLLTIHSSGGAEIICSLMNGKPITRNLCTMIATTRVTISNNKTLVPSRSSKHPTGTARDISGINYLLDPILSLQRIPEVAKSNLSTLLTINYHNSTDNEPNTKKLIDLFIETINNESYKGIILDISELPKQEHVDSVPNFIQSMRAGMKAPNIIGIVLAPNLDEIDKKYKIEKLVEIVDYVIIDLQIYNGESNFTSHMTPKYFEGSGNQYKMQSVTQTIKYFNKKGVPFKKMMLKIPFTGTVQFLKYPENNDLYDPVVMPPKVRYIPFSKVCRSIQTQDWTLRKKFRRVIGPYAFYKNQWLSYNDIEDISVLSWLVEENRMAGVYMETEFDDTRNMCCCGHYPLSTHVSNVLRNTGVENGIFECL